MDPEMSEIADDFIEGRLEKTEIHPVNVILYNETRKRNETIEDKIKLETEEIIKSRFKEFDDSKIDTSNVLINRITYIIFPIWDLDKLALQFQKMIID